MIYYIYIFMAVACFALQFIVMKQYTKKVSSTILTSAFFVAVVSLVSFIIFASIGGIHFTPTSVIFALIIALCYFACNVLGIIVLSIGKISVYTMFMLLGGMLIPFVYGITMLGENITVFKVVGAILLVLSLIIPLIDNKNKQMKNRVLYFSLCFASFISNGFIGVISKAHQISAYTVSPQSFVAMFNMFMFAYAVLTVIGFILVKRYMCYKEKFRCAESPNQDFCANQCRPLAIDTRKQCCGIDSLKTAAKISPLLLASTYSVITNLGNFLLLLAATKIDASMQFPFVTGGTIILTALLGTIVYKEKVSRLTFAGLIVTLLAATMFLF